MKKKILSKINDCMKLIDDELKSGYSINAGNSMVIEDVISTNVPVLVNTTSFDNYEDVYHLEKASYNIYNTISKIKEELELDEFFKNNKNFDIKKLKKLFDSKGLIKKFPNFNIDRYLELLNNPIMELKNFAGQVIKYDWFWVKKNLIAINQMIFNEMDLYILNVGAEGTGKSCWSSQQILYLHTFLSEVGLIEYCLDAQKLFFADILSFLEEHGNQGKHDYFKIECLDEGNELNRGNFRDEANQQFKYEMRTERKMLRIIMMNIQQIGEMDTSITLSRVNFIYDCKMKGNRTLGTLEKGFMDMYIIPRCGNIYSEKYKKLINRIDVLNAFANKLDKKKDYYIGLPKSMIVHSFKFEDSWGFDKDEYDDHIKDEMSRRKFQKSIKLTTLQAYIMVTKIREFKRLGTFDVTNNAVDKKMYDVMSKFFGKLESYFDDNPDKVIGLEKYYGKVTSSIDDNT